MIRSSLDRTIGEEQERYVDQVFTVRNLCKNYLGVNKEVYIAFMVLEKAYDKVDRDAL